MAKIKYKDIVPTVNKILSEYDFPVTLRQLYYRLISDPYNYFENAERNYKALSRWMTTARETGEVNYKRMTDRSRKIIGEGDSESETTLTFLENKVEALEYQADYYKKAKWTGQDCRIEVWCEKDALSGLISSVTEDYNVFLVAGGGFQSCQIALERADVWKRLDCKRVILIDFRDHDPSGLEMSKELSKRLLRYSELENFELFRAALNIEQVRAFSLRPNRIDNQDTRASGYEKKYGQDCWELDALPPKELQLIVGKSIKRFVDLEIWNKVSIQQAADRQFLKKRFKEIRKQITL